MIKENIFEIRRKIIHILLGLTLIELKIYDLINYQILLGIILVWSIISLLYYNLHQNKNPKGLMKNFYNLTHKIMITFERKEHIDKFPAKSVIFLFSGLLVLELFFNKNIMLASIMIWTFGDSVSALVGIHFGKIKNPLSTKFIEGTIIGIIFATITAAIFVSWIYALITATIVMIIESLDIVIYKNKVDDNFLIPVLSGCVLFLLYLL